MDPLLPETAPGADAGPMTEPAPAASAPASTEICVPTAALAMPDEQEQMTNPEPGDTVTLQVEAKVLRVEGDMAYVQPSSVNGVEMPKAGDKPADVSPEAQDQSDYSDLQNMAQQQGALG